MSTVHHQQANRSYSPGFEGVWVRIWEVRVYGGCQRHRRPVGHRLRDRPCNRLVMLWTGCNAPPCSSLGYCRARLSLNCRWAFFFVRSRKRAIFMNSRQSFSRGIIYSECFWNILKLSGRFADHSVGSILFHYTPAKIPFCRPKLHKRHCCRKE